MPRFREPPEINFNNSWFEINVKKWDSETDDGDLEDGIIITGFVQELVFMSEFFSNICNLCISSMHYRNSQKFRTIFHAIKTWKPHLVEGVWTLLTP